MTEKEWNDFKAELKELPKKYGDDIIMLNIIVDKKGERMTIGASTNDNIAVTTAIAAAIKVEPFFGRMVECAQKIVREEYKEEFKKTELPS